MGRNKKYIKELTDEQTSLLEKGYKTGQSHLTRRKCQAILLSYSGKSVDELALLFGVTVQSVYNRYKAWESEGIKGLELKPGRGRKPKLQDKNLDQVKRIKTLVENDSQNLKNVVNKINEEFGIELSKKTLKRFLKKNLNIDGNDFEKG